MAEEGGDQPWHSAVDISPPVKLPDMDRAKDDIPMFTKTPSQVRRYILPHLRNIIALRICHYSALYWTISRANNA